MAIKFLSDGVDLDALFHPRQAGNPRYTGDVDLTYLGVDLADKYWPLSDDGDPIGGDTEYHHNNVDLRTIFSAKDTVGGKYGLQDLYYDINGVRTSAVSGGNVLIGSSPVMTMDTPEGAWAPSPNRIKEGRVNVNSEIVSNGTGRHKIFCRYFVERYEKVSLYSRTKGGRNSTGNWDDYKDVIYRVDHITRLNATTFQIQGPKNASGASTFNIGIPLGGTHFIHNFNWNQLTTTSGNDGNMQTYMAIINVNADYYYVDLYIASYSPAYGAPRVRLDSWMEDGAVDTPRQILPVLRGGASAKSIPGGSGGNCGPHSILDSPFDSANGTMRSRWYDHGYYVLSY